MTDDPIVSKWTVLIVDDEPDNLGVPAELLSFFGATVHLAENGEEALQVLDKVEPTFILLDLSMPVMDGWQVIEKIRKNPQREKMTVIALTAHAMAGDRERVMEAGFNGYITKPIMIDSFVDEIKTHLNGAKP